MTVTTWKIRKARIEDIGPMAKLLRDLFAIERDFRCNLNKQRAGLRRLIAVKDAVVLVAEFEGTVIGMCTVQTVVSTAEGALAGWVEDVVVEAGFRGTGIGTALLQAAEKWAAEHKIRRLQLLTDTGNTAALDFYASRGWQTTSLVCRRITVGRDLSPLKLTSRKPAVHEQET